MKILIRALLVTVICAVSFLVGVGVTYYATTKDTNIDNANLVLHNLSSSLKLVSLVNNANANLTAIKLQQRKNISELILTVSALHPTPKNLDSNSLEALCETIQLKNNGLFDDPNIGDIRVLAKEYLNNVSDSITKQISELQKTFKGKGCKITM